MTFGVKCGGCGWACDESEIRSRNSTECPICGSVRRKVKVGIVEGVSVHDNLVLKQMDSTRPSGKKVRVELFTGSDICKSEGKWMDKERLIDRDEDRYREVVVDPESGRVVHFCEEPLSQHWGHGSDKKHSSC